MLRFGKAGNWYYGEAVDGIECRKSFFGNPGDDDNACYYRNFRYDWVECAEYGGTCQISGTTIVRFGFEKSWDYILAPSNEVDCTDIDFIEVARGKPKKCFYLRDIPYERCAEEGGKCIFDGTSLVKFGEGNFFAIKEFNGEASCDIETFGDPRPNTKKHCLLRKGAYFWNYCSQEGGKCINLPGQVVIRYGNRGKYAYTEAHNNIDCDGIVFENPVSEDENHCSYAVFNNEDIDDKLLEIGDDRIYDPLLNLPPSPEEESFTPWNNPDYQQTNVMSGEETKEETKIGRCGHNAGFGFDAKCLKQDIFGNFLSDTFSPPGLEWIFKEVIPRAIPFDFCIGDETGDNIQDSEWLGDTTCDAAPLMGNYKYGLFSGVIKDVKTCGSAEEQDLAVCVMFDRCGTASLSLSGGAVQCLAAAVGLGAYAAPLTPFIDSFSIGISPFKRFTMEQKVLVRKGSGFGVEEINTYGHVHLRFSGAFPLSDKKIGGKEIGDIIEVQAAVTYLVDFSNSFKILAEITKKMFTSDSSQSQRVINEIFKFGGEFSFMSEAKISINFSEITKKFLPDLDFGTGGASMVISGGNGSSGLKAGIYYYGRVNFDLTDFLNDLFEKFNPITKLFGFKLPKVKGVKFSLLSLGFFITDNAVGLKVDTPLWNFECMFIYKGSKASCKFNNFFFSLLWKLGKWIVKFSRKLFEWTANALISFADLTGKGLAAAGDAIEEFFEDDVANAFNKGLIKPLSIATLATGSFFKNEIGGGINKTSKVIIGATTAAIDAVGSAVEDAAEYVGDLVVQGAKTFYKKSKEAAEAVANAAKEAANAVSNAAKETAKAIEKGVNKVVGVFKKIKW
eukprot:CAMPEP_0170520566 /NCGR_PEP_ID=MMETSP0209-20121228/5862_1 /TAXON_ID=665100 ORGANISM="Litonotus pictus, Strain P1" /NCGR_SAMPLE_ID=MMETSP0209 /ASSEMBLY_ACC=CAM_ASM_000301 /LENGTH=843 /DNA_ID=CAMNT_0010806935 /DNA_START=171 /DNA_END=2699 /DNA_ORIENTATION=-